MAINPNCHVIGVIGGKGGVGKSVLAANLSCALQLEMRAQVLLLEADSKSCGDQNVIMGLRPPKNLTDVSSYTGSISAQSIGSIAAKHASGVHYIGAVVNPEDPINPEPLLLKKQLESLSRFYKYIVIDLGCDPQELQMTLLESCDALLVVTAPEVLVVNQTLKLLNHLTAATLPSDMMQVVINKAGRGGLSPNAIQGTLKKPVIASIPLDDVTTANSLQRSTPFVLSQSKTPISMSYHDLVRKLTGGLLQKLKTIAKPSGLGQSISSEESSSPLGSSSSSLSPLVQLKLRVHNELIKAMDLKKGITDTQGDPNKEKALRQKTQQVVSQIVDKAGGGLSREERIQVIKEVIDEALGLGPLEDLLSDNNVTEIMVNGCDHIFVEKSGKLTLSKISFTSNLHLRNVIERIVTPLGRRIDEKTPYVDARLADGSRVNAVIEPLAIDGPALTIRKFAKDPITVDHYLNWGTLNKPIIDFLKICVEQGLNVVISGGTGSGKTTLLNTLSRFIPGDERIITIEDAAELQLNQEHLVRLETRPANMEGTGAISIRDLIVNSLRMRPDRIVVGECRDGAALDMLQAMNTGHDGSMTTTHANSPRECIGRLETLCLMAGMDLPLRAIREQIAGAADLIVQISRLSDGSRKVLSVTEVVGMQGDTITLQEIFRYKEEGFDKNRKIIGSFQAMGLIPSFIEKLEAKGVIIPRDIFTSSPSSNAGAAPSVAKSQGSAPTPIKKPSGPRKMPARRPVGLKKTGTGGGQS